MKCPRQILGVHWWNHTINMEILQMTGLTTIGDTLTSQRLSLFGHVARLENCLPANSAVRLMVDHHEGRKLDPSWMRRPG